MEPKTFLYGETISYLKLNGTFDDEVNVNEITTSDTGYSFISDETLGSDGNGALQLANNKNIVITNVLNTGVPVNLTVPDPYTLMAFTTSFWIKQYSTSELVSGFHPLKITAHVKNENDEDVYFTYTNKTTTSYDLEIKDSNGVILAQESIQSTEEKILDIWNHVSFIIYKGTLAVDNGIVYDGYIFDLFIDGEHIGYAIDENENLPKINRVVSVSISPNDEETYLSNGALADLKIVNKLEYYPSSKSIFVPEEVNNGQVEFVFIGEIINDGITRIVQHSLHYTADEPNIVSQIKASSQTTGIIDRITSNKWTNTNNLIEVSIDNGKVNNNAAYFPGNSLQSYVLDYNILYGLSEFTIAAWVKTLDNSKPGTLLEIVPNILLDLTEEDMQYMTQEDIDVINNYKNSFNLKTNSININIYDNETVPHGINVSVSELDNYNVGEWNHIATTFKNNTLYLFVNGKLVQTKEANLELNLYDKLSYNMYSVIGASFVDDLPATGNQSANMYIDDFVIFNGAMLTEDYEVPTKPMTVHFNHQGMLYALHRIIANPAEYGDPTIRYVHRTIDQYTDSRRIVLNPSKYIVFRFSV